MSRYLLISVCDREICTEQFADLETARAQMLKELGEEFAGSDHDPGDGGETWERIATNTEFWEYEGDEHNFAFGETWAWSNMNRKYDFDWKIVEVA